MTPRYFHRHQYDGLEDAASIEASISFDPSEDLTRQEFKTDADANELLRKFGVPVPQPQVYGEVDMDSDLLQARIALEQVTESLEQLPDVVLSRFGGVPGLMDLLSRGVPIDRELLRVPKEGPQGSPGSSGGPEGASGQAGEAGAAA